MAAPHAIAIRRAQASDRLSRAANAISDYLGIAPLVLPTIGRDPNLLRAQQLEGFADWGEMIAQALNLSLSQPDDPNPINQARIVTAGNTPPEPEEPDLPKGPSLDDMTLKELLTYAAASGIDLGEASRKADVIAAIKESGKGL